MAAPYFDFLTGGFCPFFSFGAHWTPLFWILARGLSPLLRQRCLYTTTNEPHFTCVSSCRPPWAPNQRLSHPLDVFWRPYSLIGARWLLLYYTFCCPQTVNPPENHIAAGNGVQASKVEMNAKKPLHCCDSLTVLHIRFISKHAVFYCPLLHSYWNGIV
jgi:hypothetical protein